MRVDGNLDPFQLTLSLKGSEEIAQVSKGHGVCTPIIMRGNHEHANSLNYGGKPRNWEGLRARVSVLRPSSGAGGPLDGKAGGSCERNRIGNLCPRNGFGEPRFDHYRHDAGSERFRAPRRARD